MIYCDLHVEKKKETRKLKFELNWFYRERFERKTFT